MSVATWAVLSAIFFVLLRISNILERIASTLEGEESVEDEEANEQS